MPASKHAVFFVYVWPEPLSSAAGVRTRELIAILQAEGWQLSAVSPSGASPHREALEALGIATLSCDPNASPATDAALGALSPTLVVYDRFVMEEQFGWRARALWPAALHIIDTQDLHSLRRARERLAKAGAPWEKVMAPSNEEMGDDLLRELASFYRSDGALFVSSFERDLVVKRLGYAGVLSLPFSATAEAALPAFADRSGYCFLGNFRHPPNLDSVRWLLTEHWPLIRSRLPTAELHLYGAYPPSEISTHKGAQGVFAHGPVVDHRAALLRHRVMLAPLRFGAGIKGKVLEAWATGVAVAGSPLTFEGMGDAGVTCASPEEFATVAVRLHESEPDWAAEQTRSALNLRGNFSFERVRNDFLTFIEQGLLDLPQSREANLVGRMLRHQQSNSTKYFSRWIEAKNKKD